MPDRPTLSHKALKAPQANLERLRREQATAGREAETAAVGLRAAEDHDAELATALRRDQEEPKPSASAVTERKREAERRARALRQAVEDEEAALDAAVAKHRGEIDRDLRKALDKARSEYLKLLDSLTVKHAD